MQMNGGVGRGSFPNPAALMIFDGNYRTPRHTNFISWITSADTIRVIFESTSYISMAFALFDFFNRNEVEIGRTAWITSKHLTQFSNEVWDHQEVVHVAWPKKMSLQLTRPEPADSETYPAKVVWFSG